MAVDLSVAAAVTDKVRLYDVVNVAPTQVTDVSGNFVDGIEVTFSIAGIANQTIQLPLRGLTVGHVHDHIVARVVMLLEIFDIEGPMVALDADGKPILPNPVT